MTLTPTQFTGHDTCTHGARANDVRAHITAHACLMVIGQIVQVLRSSRRKSGRSEPNSCVTASKNMGHGAKKWRPRPIPAHTRKASHQAQPQQTRGPRSNVRAHEQAQCATPPALPSLPTLRTLNSPSIPTSLNAGASTSTVDGRHPSTTARPQNPSSVRGLVRALLVAWAGRRGVSG